MSTDSGIKEDLKALGAMVSAAFALSLFAFAVCAITYWVMPELGVRWSPNVTWWKLGIGGGLAMLLLMLAFVALLGAGLLWSHLKHRKVDG